MGGCVGWDALLCCVVLCCVVLCCVVLCCFVLCSVVLYSAVSCRVMSCCVVPKALLPKGKDRDVYQQVQVNGRAVCVVRALCASVFRTGQRAGRPGGSPTGYRS